MPCGLYRALLLGAGENCTGAWPVLPRYTFAWVIIFVLVVDHFFLLLVVHGGKDMGMEEPTMGQVDIKVTEQGVNDESFLLFKNEETRRERRLQNLKVRSLPNHPIFL